MKLRVFYGFYSDSTTPLLLSCYVDVNSIINRWSSTANDRSVCLRCDLDLWPFDLRMQLVNLCPQLNLSCKFDKIPTNGL